MALAQVCDGRHFFGYPRASSSNDYISEEELDPNINITTTVKNRDPRRSPNIIRPCHYILQVLGIWKPRDGKFESPWRIYRAFMFLVWFACLVAIMCLSFVHYGFTTHTVHIREILNSFCTCLDFLCPFVFTLYYFNRGQFVEVATSVQNISEESYEKLRRIARWYTLMSVLLWSICAAFFMAHWFPFFSKSWHYAVYIPVIVFISGWWGVWLTIYGFVCQIHSLQIDAVIKDMKSEELSLTIILQRYSQIQTSLEKTQKDFNIMISLALTYHTLDLIIYSLAYFNSTFGNHYPLWQYIGTVLFDLTSLVFKLYPPAMVSAAAHRIVVQACKRCRVPSSNLPLEDMQLFQYMALCEEDMGLKILGIRITAQLSLKVLLAIFTAAIAFLSFILVQL